ncbi:hypothetical protein F4774DRAFT_404679 [Daldinia eschscholtzii]|nr:hypothetical protein F4774DRAFT_404679 [Daldinia eschscholtzii]
MKYQPFHIPILPVSDEAERQKLKKEVVIYHPGYAPPIKLLTLRASDYGSLDYGILYYACCIVAGNVWKPSEGRGAQDEGPFFSSGRVGSESRIVFTDDLVPAGRYYFHVPPFTNDEPYPIVPSFHDWIYPNETPKPWKALKIEHTPAIATRHKTPSTSSLNTDDLSADTSHPYTDGFIPPILQSLSSYDGNRSPCPVTYDLTSTQEGHIMPKTCRNWAAINDMARFKPEDGVRFKRFIDHPCNTVFLRDDVHSLYDDNYIIMVPKPDSAHKGKYRLGMHVWNPPNKSEDSDMQVFSFYQNRPCYPIAHVPVEFFFARFAWAIFTHYTINVLDSDNANNEYSVHYVVVNKDGSRTYEHKMALGSDIDKLSAKATGGKGRKRDNSHVTGADPAPNKRRELCYSWRTGEVEWESDDDGFEPGDHGGLRNNYYSDESNYLSDDCNEESDHSSQHAVPELSSSVLSLGNSDKSSDHGDQGPLNPSSLALAIPTHEKTSHNYLDRPNSNGHVH